MTRSFTALALLALASATGVPTHAAAQSAAVEKALTPAPERARDATTVVRWNADHTYEVLQEGDGPLVCYDRSDEARRAPFDVMCTVRGNLDRVAQNRRFRSEAADREAEAAMVAAADADGSRVDAVFGSVWIMMRGQDMASASRHMTIAMPYATAESSGFPDHGRDGGAWLMAAGTSEAHLMTPGL